MFCLLLVMCLHSICRPRKILGQYKILQYVRNSQRNTNELQEKMQHIQYIQEPRGNNNSARPSMQKRG